MKKNLDRQRGITLIALAISIIVLLILAGIAISMLSGENGILKQAVNAKKSSEIEAQKEKIKLALTATMMNEDHNIEEGTLEKELKKYFKEVSVERNNGFIIKVDGEIYSTDEEGNLSDNVYTISESQMTDGKANLSNSIGKNLTDYKMYGNCVQDGTPAPEKPIEIQSVGDLVTDKSDENYGKYKISVIVTGKNLIPYPYKHTTKTSDGLTYTDNGDGSITVTGTATADSYFTLCVGIDFGDAITENNTNGVYSTSKKVRYNPNNKSVSINFSAGTTVDETFYPQLERDTVSTEYEPYVKPKTYNIYLNEPLRKVGEYADYIDFRNQKAVRNVIQGFLDGSEGWGISNKRYYLVRGNLKTKCLGTSVVGIISNALPSKTWNEIRNSGTGIATYCDNRIDIRADNIWSTVDEAKEYMTNNPIQYIAPRLETLEEKIELPSIITHEGTNIITVDTTTKPSNMEIQYVSK